MATCTITPVSAFQSTNLNSKIDCFGRLSDRIVRALGAPLISVEIHQDQLFENISIACEMFTKFAGYTKEYLIFDSDLYEQNKGIRLDILYTLANTDLTLANKVTHSTESIDTAPYLTTPQSVYVATSSIAATYFAYINTLSSVFTEGVHTHQLLDATTYNDIVSSFANNVSVSSVPISAFFNQSRLPNFITGGTCAPSGSVNTSSVKFNNMFDYDVMDYRKVIAVTDFEEGSTTGINTLFTIEQTLAQQTYFSYAMGNYGFDLISWYVLKNWLETREKMLATKQSFEFNDRTQYLKLYPQPSTSTRYYGIISCYVERPIRDIIKEPWVYQYALALTKLSVALVRGKYGNLTLFGGQTFNATDLFTQGTAEKKELEERLYTGAVAGFDAEPPMFFIG
jgi:hypothetical protein